MSLHDAREALFMDFVGYIREHWKYRKRGLDLSRDVLALRGAVCADCGPIAFCFLALLREAKLLGVEEWLDNLALRGMIQSLEAQTCEDPLQADDSKAPFRSRGSLSLGL